VSALDSTFTKGIQAFLLPTVLGGVCYVAASLAARFISPVPKQTYFARVILMGVISLAWFYFWLSHTDPFVIINGQAPSPKKLGTYYGAFTILAWGAVSLVAWPAKKRDDSQQA